MILKITPHAVKMNVTDI